jgi:hypothetical protein
MTIFKQFVEKIRVSLKPDSTLYQDVYDNISLNSSYDEKCFGKICRGNQNKHFMYDNFFSPRKSCRLGDNVKKL